MNAAWQRRLPLIATAAISVVIFLAASVLYDRFGSLHVVLHIFSDNAFLGITAIGMTLVIFCGGIDLSVGAVIGFTSILVATLIENHGWHPAGAAAFAVLLGALFGAGMGAIIHVFALPPFLITLAGMFLARGAAFWISTESIGITHPLYLRLTAFVVPLGAAGNLPLTGLCFFGVFIIGYVLAHYTRFGRNLIAIGGNEQSALLMGLPVGWSKIGVYTFNGAAAAFAGLVATLYTGSGNSSLGAGLELDSIAIVVIGGTLLIGGRGHMLGTLFGLAIFGTIQSAIYFDGRLNPWWVRIVVGALLLAFILVQRLFVREARH